MLKPALVILTLMGDGGTRITLSAADSPEECEARREVLTQVLTHAGQAPLLAICGETALRLSPFVHGVPEQAEVNRYRLTMQGGGFIVEPLGDAPCLDARDAEPAIWCARSAQIVLPDE
ncbi:MAG: hypothetical protein Q4G24_12845 [Paracoccus sp. (in: a-proteobacteria)]|uniref:hypothetical protein n=1 Tax=Paracoccus sp. TaxID=267 RepID=UPI0026E0CEE1|nr:hypothetical protein [Paracoccus sp. (in: a-proteobacteria)]MDO5622347.1 hypothetical protein [Paracoccus sp. (in: a-proteobacteria)]